MRTILKSFSTTNVDRTSRFGYWADLHTELFCPLVINPARPERFDAELSVETLGPIAIARTFSAAACIERTERHLARAPEHRFCVLTAVHGRIEVRHCGHDLVLEERDSVLLDQHRPHRIEFADANVALGLQIHGATLQHLLPQPEIYCARPLRGRSGLGDTLAALLESLWRRVLEGVPAGSEHTLAHTLLELLATAYAVEHGGDAHATGIRNARKLQITRYIEANLRDADLNVDAIAAHLGISGRYVRMLFADEPETVSAYILRRRLERSAELMSDPRWHGRTVTDAAFEWGFSSTAHFSRVFKRQFGLCPTDYRAQRR